MVYIYARCLHNYFATFNTFYYTNYISLAFPLKAKLNQRR